MKELVGCCFCYYLAWFGGREGHLDPGERRRTTILRSSPYRGAISGIATLALRCF